MGKAYLFYNPRAGGGTYLEDLDLLPFVLDRDTVLCDMTKPETYGEKFFTMEPEDILVVCGGDGTLNRFVNILADIRKPNEIYWYPAGKHNDLARDRGRCYPCNPFPVSKLLRELPKLRIGGREGYFLTGSVFSTASRGPGKQDQNDRPVGVKLNLDRRMYYYQNVRFLAVMQGRYCCGGLSPDPERGSGERMLSCVVISGCGQGRANRLLRRLNRGRIPTSRHLTVRRAACVQADFADSVTLLTDGEQQSGVRQMKAWKQGSEG